MQRAILVVDPDADRRSRLRPILAKNGSRVVGEVDGPEEAMRVAVMAVPDVAVIAADMGNGGGTHLAGRLAMRREAEGLRRTLEARKVIERAKGLLMEMEGIPEQEAFARIRQKSMDTQRPMEEIARAVILAAEISGRTR